MKIKKKKKINKLLYKRDKSISFYIRFSVFLL